MAPHEESSEGVPVTGVRRAEQRVRHLVVPLPKVEVALLAVASRYEKEIGHLPADSNEAFVKLHVADALRLVAEELHHWL